MCRRAPENWANVDNGPPSARARNRQSAVVHQEQRDQECRLGDRRRYYAAAFRLRRTRRRSPSSTRSENSSPARSTPGRSVQRYGPTGPETKFLGIPAGMKQNRPTSDGLRFYGIGRIDGDTEILTMSLHDVAGKRLYSVDLEPAA
jgi:phosphodiesterase/alkaline phosphatase D-like protein